MEKESEKKPRLNWDLIEVLMSRKGTLLLSVLILGVGFKSWLEKLWLEYPVNLFLRHFESEPWTDFLLMGLIGLAIASFGILDARGYRISCIHLLQFSGFALVLFLYRTTVIDAPFQFIGFSFMPELKYVDLVFIYYLVFLGYYAHKKTEKSIDPPKVGFQSDEAILESKKDELGRKNFAKEIADQLLWTNTKKSFNLGINGPWGSGKTSFLNMIEENLEEKSIIVKYNPWEAHDSSSLILHFFEEFKAVLSKYHSGISKPIAQYVRSLALTDENAFSKGLSGVLDLIGKGKTSSESYREIEKILADIGKKVVIIIDDLDRLSYEEIFEVLKLIRNTADFKNTSYVVSYDREFVIKQLKEKGEGFTPKFLEKFFQVEFGFPPLQPGRLVLFFKNNLLKAGIEPEVVEMAIMDCFEILEEYLTTIRVAIRLVNFLIIEMRMVAGEYILKDFILITIIKEKVPGLYYQIFQNRLGVSKSKDFKIQFNGTKENLIRVWSKEEVETLSEADEKLIINILRELFPQSKDNGTPLSIRFQDCFDIYFSQPIMEFHFNRSDFEDALNGGVPELEHYIVNSFKNGVGLDLNSRLKVFGPLSKNGTNKVFQALFEAGKRIEKSDLFILFSALNINVKQTREINDSQLKESSYKEKAMFLNWPSNMKERLYLYNLLRHLAHETAKNEFPPSNPFSNEEIIKRQILFTKNFLRIFTKVDSDFLEFFSLCEDNSHNINQEIVPLLKDWILNNDLPGFLKKKTLFKHQGEIKMTHYFGQIFGNENHVIKETFEPQRKHPAVGEFLSFLDASSKKGYDHSFHFKEFDLY